ncbi:MAG: benzoate/H(+) symporter BenE family transporter [Pseudomonadota bacterium]
MRVSVVISALMAVTIGVGASLAVLLAAAEAVGATPEQTSSWIAVSSLMVAITCLVLSAYHRMPVLTAWSTPGAALIAATSGLTINQVVGAFFFAAVLMMATAGFRGIGVLVERIPTPIASAMLAGVLFEFVIAPFTHLSTLPGLVLPMLIGFGVLRLFSPIWAVVAVLVLGLALAQVLGLSEPVSGLQATRIVWIQPEFDPGVLLGVGLPLYLVTMASQNLPGFAVLKAAGYEPPSRIPLAVTGLASLGGAGFGAHATNLAAITASLCTGPDAHPDSSKRWLCGPVAAFGYGAVAILGGSLVALFGAFPLALIATIAGIALTGPFIGAIAGGLSVERQRFAAVTTFIVTASGVSAWGIGAAFWGLAAGLLVHGLETANAGLRRQAK